MGADDKGQASFDYYFEMMRQWAVYHNGWFAITMLPCCMTERQAPRQCPTTFSISLTRPARNRRMFSISSGIACSS
jgi:hypothetical protein